MNRAFDENYFGRGADQYARYRPEYPNDLFDMLAGMSARDRAWDCATGTGQAARSLAAHFREVVATDSSADQLARTSGPSNIDFRQAAAESSCIETSSVDLITVATALHWFDLDAFWIEVARVARQDAVLAFWCYDQPDLSNPDVQSWFDHLSDAVLGEFWDERVHLARDGYSTVEPPFRAVTQIGSFRSKARWRDAEDLIGYCRTWSALERYRRARGTEPISAEMIQHIKRIWPAQGVDVVWNIRPRVFTVEQL